MIIKNLQKLLDKKQKRKVLLLLIMMIFCAGFEMTTVTLIIPLVSVIMNKDMIQTNAYLKYFYDLFGMHTENQFLILLVLTLCAAYIIKNLFMLLLYNLQANFVTRNQFKLSKELLENFMNRPYEYYLNASTGDIIRIIQWDVGNVFMLLNNVLSFLSELFIFVALVVLLLVVDWGMTLGIAMLLGVTMFVTKFAFKKPLVRAGEKTQKYSSIMNKWLLQSIEGIKEIKILHKEKKFIYQYELNGKKNAKVQKQNSVLSQTPRLLIETVSMCGMLGIIAIILASGRHIENMLPQIAAFGMAAVRLMPSANRMNT